MNETKGTVHKAMTIEIRVRSTLVHSIRVEQTGGGFADEPVYTATLDLRNPVTFRHNRYDGTLVLAQKAVAAVQRAASSTEELDWAELAAIF